MTISIEGDNASVLFTKAVHEVVRSGRPASPRGMPTRELLGVHLTLTRPRARLLHLPPARIPNPAFAAAETVWHLMGTDASWIFHYNSRLREYSDDGLLRGAYGPRIRRWGGSLDQLASTIATLHEDPDSRRAVIQVYDPSRDSAGHRDVPCTLSFRFHLRRGRLYMCTSMRSQDVWVGFPYDLFFTTVLHELMAGWVGAELGEYRHQVDSLHIYERDLAAADALPIAAAGPAVDMPSLSTPWNGFDDMLSQTLQGDSAHAHPGWLAMSASMRSYRLWKGGEHESAQHVAREIPPPLGPALRDWYAHLWSRRKRPVATGTGR